MREIIGQALRRSAEVKGQLASDQAQLESLERIADLLIAVIKRGGTVYVCGNGGSAADSIHFFEELCARYKNHRRGIRSMHFLDPAYLTCWANDYEYDSVFRRGAETYCTANDVLFVFTTSGNSRNVLLAVEAAKGKGCPTVALTGKGGGKIAAAADYCVVVPAAETERIQETHITLVHILCEIIEQELADFLEVRKLSPA